jgi:hypothetical protein
VHEHLTRREFLARASVLSAGAGLGATAGGAGRPAVAQTPIKRVSGARVKTGLNAYSFVRTLNDQLKGRAKGTSLFELIDFCAEQGFDAIDPTGYFFPGYPKVPSDAYLNDFKRRAFQNGVDISGTGITPRSGSRLRRGSARRSCASSPAPSPTATPGTRWPPGWPTT